MLKSRFFQTITLVFALAADSPAQQFPSRFQVNVDQFGQNILGDAANEPSICIDPHNPNRMAIGWRQFDSVSNSFREAGVAFSRDAGHTWTNLGVLEPARYGSDPVLAADSNGTFYYNSLYVSGTSYTCYVYKSFDAGATWGPRIFAYGGDKSWMVVDTTDQPSNGVVYQAWSEGRFTRSFTRADSWMTPMLDGAIRYGTMDIGPNSEVYVAGVTSTNATTSIVRSFNAFDPDQVPDLSNFNVPLGHGLRLGVGGPNPDGMVGQVNVAVDRSNGPYRGRVYVLLTGLGADLDPGDVLFNASSDRGRTWSSSARRLNDDPAVPQNWQWFGTLSVAPNGRIDAIWNDCRNDSNHANPIFSVTYYSFSTDGGATWSVNTPITPPWNHTLGRPNGSNKIGDYYHMISDNVGVNLAFAATFNGEQDVYFMRIGDFDCNGNGIGDAIDIVMGSSLDLDNDGIPDECEPRKGDLNCDGATNNFDIDPFVLALTNPAGYWAAYPNCDRNAADINRDHRVDNFDIDPFVACLVNGGCP